MSKVLIIAEAGVNHNGDLDMAKKLVQAAALAGADYVKFQTFRTENLVSTLAQKADYQKKNLGDQTPDSQFEMLKKLELSVENHNKIIEFCKEAGIKFLSTAFDLESIDLLNKFNIDLFKIPSGEITNLQYLKKIGSYNRRIIISTGMCVMSEIEDAINVLIDSGADKNNISILHCTTEYPTPMKDVNLNAMLSIKNQFGLPVGYSDHTLGIEVPIAAVAMGASIIEKHFTLDKNLSGPDHKASLNPSELKEMVSAIRNVEICLGSFTKQPTDIERKNSLVGRKSIHLSKALNKQHIITESDLIMKRPGDGISPMLLQQVIGKKLKQDCQEEHKLTFGDLE